MEGYMRRRDFVALLSATTATFAFDLKGNASMADRQSEAVSADEFHRSGYLYVPSFISESHARSFDVSTRSLPSRRVICGDPNVSWTEQELLENHELYDFFLSSPVKDAVAALLNKNSGPRHVTCWVSRYRQNEYIGPHKDRAGTLQIVLSLNGTGEENGGALNLLVEGKTITLQFKPGDALFFRATSITHYTTPIIATMQCPDPRRVVGVGRYFFDEA
jgi:hypothetical protein